MVCLRRAIECVDDGGRMPFPFGMGVVIFLTVSDADADDICVCAALVDSECLTRRPTHAPSPALTT